MKSAFVSILGLPSVGKSTILNAITGVPISIVSSKAQTTRRKIMGILTVSETQLVFVDTPGFHKPENALGEKMIKDINTTFDDCDIIILVVDARGNSINETEKKLIDKIHKAKFPSILVINKVDLVKDKAKIIKRIEDFSKIHSFDAVIPMSATKNKDIDLLKKELLNMAPEGPHYFADDELTNLSEREIFADFLRESALFFLQKEIPHGLAVKVDKMHRKNKILHINATIYCEKESHKGIIIGKNGEMLKKIATRARIQAEDFLKIKINLTCRVKTAKNWRDDTKFINTMVEQ
ncbi:MAG: GTPase Era [Clostridia bacterium]|nr:GTPase Era [Clostridia bacterium]